MVYGIIAAFVVAVAIIGFTAWSESGGPSPDIDDTPVAGPDGFDVMQSGYLSQPVDVRPGDRLQLEYRDRVVAEAEIEERGHYNGYAMFTTGEGQFDANYGLGGVFLNRD